MGQVSVPVLWLSSKPLRFELLPPFRAVMLKQNCRTLIESSRFPFKKLNTFVVSHLAFPNCWDSSLHAFRKSLVLPPRYSRKYVSLQTSNFALSCGLLVILSRPVIFLLRLLLLRELLPFFCLLLLLYHFLDLDDAFRFREIFPDILVIGRDTELAG